MWSSLNEPGRQPRPQGLLLVQNGDRRNRRPRLPKWLQKFVRISSRKAMKCLRFVWITVPIAEYKQGRQTLESTSKKPFHHVSRDKILHDSWSISAALARGFSDRHFERGECPGDEFDLDGSDFSALSWCSDSLWYLIPRKNVSVEVRDTHSLYTLKVRDAAAGIGGVVVIRNSAQNWRPLSRVLIMLRGCFKRYLRLKYNLLLSTECRIVIPG